MRSSDRSCDLLASYSRLPRSASPRAGASKSDPYYERRVVSSPSARYAGSPSLHTTHLSLPDRGSPSYYQYGPARSVGPEHWPRDDVTYTRPPLPRHPLLTQMVSDVGGGGGSRSRGGSLPLMYCFYVEDEASMAAGSTGDWLAPGSSRHDLALREACEEPAD